MSKEFRRIAAFFHVNVKAFVEKVLEDGREFLLVLNVWFTIGGYQV